MAFELKLELTSMDISNKVFTLTESSDWATAPPSPPTRAEWGIMLEAFQDTKEGLQPIGFITDGDNLTETTKWLVEARKDGKYLCNAYMFPELAFFTTPVADDIAYDKGTDTLVKYDGTVWSVVELVDVKDEALHSQKDIDIPVLMYSENYQNRLNLEYISTFRGDVVNGTPQNKLYYKRSALDYCRSLLDGARYAWEAGAEGSFINITDSLTELMTVDKTN